jgi:beta-lactamase regulating signal transducer with metallopeptidase domain
MNGILAHTLVWTGVLIALVLLVRRPVARWCGPQVAYALWALPALRLILPPITVPAWMAPPPAPTVAEPIPANVPVAEEVLWQTAEVASAAPLQTAPAAGFDVMALLADWPIIEALLLAWLGGAGVFLWRRFGAYFELREALLAEAREVGRIPASFGAIRLVETPDTAAPLAFGVLDPVIALPPGFMALPDRRARDLALAHELAHHRGGDLVINVLVQPLFALHWWNPLGRYGWLALRRDQEAACDARVIARADAEERAAYALLIARFAATPNAAPNAAITAPMACPVLGEKSIIERLRSLSMSHSSPRSRIAGGAVLGAALLILPLTASISYAASETAQEVPEPPAPPAPPEAPMRPEPPLPPEPPTPPEPPMGFTFMGSDGEGEDGANVIVTERIERGEDGKERKVRIVRRFGPRDEPMTEAEHAEMEAALQEGLAEADRALADLPRTVSAALAEAEVAMAEAKAARGDAARARAEARTASRTRVMMLKSCTSAFDGEAEVIKGKDGAQTVMICQPRIAASARLGLEQARDEIAGDKDIPEETRKQVLRTLDAQIARWKEKEG